MLKTFTSMMLVILNATILLAQNDYEFEDPSTGDAGQNFARVTYTDQGNLLFSRGEEYEMDKNMAITAGTTLRTDYRSYAELELIDGSLVQLNGTTVIELQAINDVFNEESLTVINLQSGSLFFHISSQPEWLKNRVLRVDSPHGSVYIETPGLYRIDQKEYQLKCYVYRGVCELAGEHDSALVRSGEYATIKQLGSPMRSKPFNSYYKDHFTSWAYSRTTHLPGVSSRYVAPEIARYSYTLDDGGNWRYSDEYQTHVWVPDVPQSWRPYYRGYWCSSGPSLSWVGHYDWSWVTGHYGRWGWSVSFGWHWIPDRFYAPAWVAWTVVDGLLGWTPLGRWNSPFYYDRYHRQNTYVVNHFHNTWVYREPNRIHVRNDNHNGRIKAKPRRVTHYNSRAIRISKSMRSNPNEYVRAVRSPRSSVKTRTTVAERTRTFTSRSSNTRAQSRYQSSPKDRTFIKVSPEKAGRTQVNRTSSGRTAAGPRTTTSRDTSRAIKNRGETKSRVNRSQTTIKRSSANERVKPSRSTTSRSTTKIKSRTETRSTPEKSRTNTTKRKPISSRSDISRDRVTRAPRVPLSRVQANRSSATTHRSRESTSRVPSRPSYKPASSSRTQIQRNTSRSSANSSRTYTRTPAKAPSSTSKSSTSRTKPKKYQPAEKSSSRSYAPSKSSGSSSRIKSTTSSSRTRSSRKER
ncbi:MAG: hypothetical protein CSA81_10990 [Acidobacteria bacterium]|nr:MAG: hypothetical protein CSA81_10990 [Acidobacteriota bacterium]